MVPAETNQQGIPGPAVQLDLRFGGGAKNCVVMSEPPASAAWIEDLVRFLHAQPGVRAVRVDPTGRKLAVATIGEIDLAAVAAQVADTIKAIETRLAAAGPAGAAVPRGYVLRRVGATTEVVRATCSTAESLWLWREFAWPEVEPVGAPPMPEWKPLAALAATCGGLGLTAFVGGHFWGEATGLTRGLYLAALVAGGWDAAKDMGHNLRAFKLDIHFLMLAVAAGAMAIGAWGEAMLLLFLFSASGAMEEFALDRTHREVSALLKASPKQATLVLPDGGGAPRADRGGRPRRPRPGQAGRAFSADGDVAKGRSASDESTLTGEALPVEKGPGDPVFSGTLNLWGAVEVIVRRRPAESTLQKIIRLIQTAQKLKAPSERFTDRFGAKLHLARARRDGGDVLRLVAGLPPAAVRELGGAHVGLLPGHDAAGRGQPVRAGAVDPLGDPRGHRLGRAPRHPVSRRRGHREAGADRSRGARQDRHADDRRTDGGRLRELPGGAASRRSSSWPARSRRTRSIPSPAPSPSTAGKTACARGRSRSLSRSPGRACAAGIDGATLLLGRRELLEDGPLAEWARQLPPAAAELSEVWVVGQRRHRPRAAPG